MQTLDEVGRWIFDTCIAFGARTETAYTVAGLFCAGLREKGWE